MIVYLVQGFATGDPGCIDGVYLDKQKAEERAAILNKTQSYFGFEVCDYEVTE